MSLHSLTVLIDNSLEPVKMTFDGFLFEFTVTDSELVVTSNNLKDTTAEPKVNTFNKDAKFGVLIGSMVESTRINYPEDDIATRSSPVTITRGINSVISNGANYVFDESYVELVNHLKKNKHVTLHVDGYIVVIRYANEQILVIISYPDKYFNTTYFGRGTLDDVVQHILSQFDKLDIRTDNSDEMIIKALRA